MAEENEQPEEANEEKKPSMMPKIMVSGFITMVVVAETFIFFFMVPSADDVAALAEARLIDKVENSMREDGEEVLENEEKKIEIPLGEFGITFIPRGSDRNYRVEFPLYGTIYKKDEKVMEELFAEKKARFQHRVMLEVRNANLDELMENQLGLIQRRILATSIDVLEEDEADKSKVPMLLEVSFPQPGFQVWEE